MDTLINDDSMEDDGRLQILDQQSSSRITPHAATPGGQGNTPLFLDKLRNKLSGPGYTAYAIYKCVYLDEPLLGLHTKYFLDDVGLGNVGFRDYP